MSTTQIHQTLEIPCSAIQESKCNSIFLIRPLGDDSPYFLEDFGNASGSTFKIVSGRYAEINKPDDKDIRKALSDWNFNRINENFAEFLVTFFPDLASHRQISDLGDDEIDDLYDEFSEKILSKQTLTSHIISVLGGYSGILVQHTSEYSTQNLFLNGMVSIPSSGLETSEFIDLKSKRLVKIFRKIENYDSKSHFYGTVDQPLEFDEFQIFEPYNLTISNTNCELRIDGLHGSFLISCVLKSRNELNGSIEMIKLEEEIYAGRDYKTFRVMMDEIIKPSASQHHSRSTQEYLNEFDKFNPPQNDIDLIWDQLRSGNFEEALGDANKLAEIYPHSHKPLLAIGMAFTQMNNFEKAQEYFSNAIALSPNSSARINLGSLLLQNEKYQDALPVFLTAAALDPFNPTIIKNLMFVRHKLGMPTDSKLPFSAEFRKTRSIEFSNDRRREGQ